MVTQLITTETTLSLSFPAGKQRYYLKLRHLLFNVTSRNRIMRVEEVNIVQSRTSIMLYTNSIQFHFLPAQKSMPFELQP